MSATHENAQVLNLVHAMVGAIGPNFRRVTLEVTSKGEVTLRFLLERDDEGDRGEISEIGFAFDALQDAAADTQVSVICSDHPLHQIDLPGRPVFGRRE